MNLEGHTALVTGSSRNIGQAIAETFAEAGADVGITANTDEAGCAKTKELVEAAGGEAAIAMGNIADPDDVERIVESIRDELGPIDILVNNASYRPLKPFLEVSVEDWGTVHNIDLRAMGLFAQQVLPDMLDRGDGRILNIVGDSAFKGTTQKTHVMAQKAGIPGLTRGLAMEFGPEGVRSNAISLGLIDTDRNLDNYDGWEQKKRRTSQMAALRRIGDPQEIADAALFFVSDRSSFITGQTVHVNGGTFPIFDAGAVE
jgi:3-oxoacyl-[acyl-carrier protein] reductase